MIKYHAPEIERQLQYEFSGRDIFEECKNCTVGYLTEIHRAVRFLYLLSQSFASRGNHYGYGTNIRPSPQIFYKDVLTDLKERLRNTYVENLSVKMIIEKYDREYTFFYADPPYFETTGYNNEFEEKEHLLLRDKSLSIEGKFLLTINDHQRVREWYKDFNISEVEVPYTVSKDKTGRRKFKELIITNY